MSGALASAIYLGSVTHARSRPREHRLAYRIFSLLIDLDELEELDRRLRFFSIGRFNLVSFSPRDRGQGSGDLRRELERHLIDAGIEADGGAIRLFTMPRVLGFSFNPLSIFFCHKRSGELAAILWEVDNTFGERHAYLVPAPDMRDGEISQRCDKRFYVSPFMDMDLTYDFRIRPPSGTFSLVIDVSDGAGLMLRARHLARRVELSDRLLLRYAASFPFLAFGVLGGIHWEALKIWLKGIPIRSRPAPPAEPVSVSVIESTPP